MMNQEKKQNFTEKFFRRLELIFVLLFFTVGFLQYCSVTYGKQIISFVQWPGILLGLTVLAYRVFRIRRFLQNKVIHYFIIYLSSKKIEQLNKTKLGLYDDRNTIINEFLLSIREIKAFNIFNPIKKRIDDYSEVECGKKRK